MPMDFPDMASLKRAAQVHNFREPNGEESESQYRQALAEHVEPIDHIESCEIRHGVGWDKFTDAQNMEMLERKMGAGNLSKTFMELDEGERVV